MTKSPYRLVGPSPNEFVGLAGKVCAQVCKVSVYVDQPGLPPAVGVLVSYQVVTGPAEFENGKKRISARTDESGETSVDVRFVQSGLTIVRATIRGDTGPGVFYRGLTEGITHHLEMMAPLQVVAGSRFGLRVRLLDHLGQPAKKSFPVVFAATGVDSVVRGGLRKLGTGVFSGRLKLPTAGEWRIYCYDEKTRAINGATVHVQVGQPVRLTSVTQLHSAGRPVNEATVRARLVDAQGNALDPARIKSRSGAKTLRGTIVDNEAPFIMPHAGNGTTQINMWARGSTVRHTEPIDFPAARLGSPGVIWLGSTFQTPLFLFPNPSELRQSGSVRVRFNPEQVSFVRFIPHPAVSAQIQKRRRGELQISIEARKRRPRNDIEGLEIGIIEWQCEEEGETCFTLTARMSPEKASYTSCEKQKRDNPTDLCINFIYPETDPNAASIKTNCETMAAKVKEVYSSPASVTACCPMLHVCAHYSTLSAADWAKVATALGGVAQIKDLDKDLTTVEALDLKQKRKGCFNVYMIEFHEPPGVTPHAGGTDLGPMPRQAVLDWRGNLLNCAHELGHALMGGAHSGNPRNIMSTNATGTEVDPKQCETIFANVDKYGSC